MVFEWCRRAREDLQNNLWGPVCLCTVLYVLSTGPRAGRLLPAASCFVQRIVTTVGIRTVLVGTGLVCSTVPITTGDRAAGRDGGGGRRGASHRPGVHRGGGVVGGGVAGRVAVCVPGAVSLRLDHHLRALRPGPRLVVRHHERRVLLFRDAHVVTGVCLLHYMTRTFRSSEAELGNFFFFFRRQPTIV